MGGVCPWSRLLCKFIVLDTGLLHKRLLANPPSLWFIGQMTINVVVSDNKPLIESLSTDLMMSGSYVSAEIRFRLLMPGDDNIPLVITL